MKRPQPAKKGIPSAVLDALLAAALDDKPRSRFPDLPSPVPLQPQPAGEKGPIVIIRQAPELGV